MASLGIAGLERLWSHINLKLNNYASKEYVNEKITSQDLYLNSSTEGSSKRFKLTIDDSGVLTATEIVD